MTFEEKISYVNNYINNNYFKVVELEDYNYKMELCKKIVNLASNIDFSNGDYDFFIDAHIKRNMELLNSSTYKKFLAAKEYISLIINYNASSIGLKTDNISKLSILITKILIFKYKYEDIIMGKYDNIIIELMNSKEMLMEGLKQVDYEYVKVHGTYVLDEPVKSSIDLSNIEKDSIENGTNNKIKLREKLEEGLNFTKENAKALIAAILLLSSLSILMYGSIKKEMHDDAIEIVSEFDNYSYPKIDESAGNEFVLTQQYVNDKYAEYAKYGERFIQLCFYNVYKSCETEPLNVMDAIISLSKYNTECEMEFAKSTFKKVSYNSYISYVYDMLDKAGIEDIKKESIITTVNNYNNQVGNYKGKNPYNLLSNEDKSSLKQLMRIYDEYCDKLTIELAENIKQDNKETELWIK